MYVIFNLYRQYLTTQSIKHTINLKRKPFPQKSKAINLNNYDFPISTCQSTRIIL